MLNQITQLLTQNQDATTIQGLIAAAQQSPDWAPLLRKYRIEEKLTTLAQQVAEDVNLHEYEYTLVPELNKIFLKQSGVVVRDLLLQDHLAPVKLYFPEVLSSPELPLLAAYLNSGPRYHLLWLALLLKIN